MRHLLLTATAVLLGTAALSTQAQDRDTVAGIPVNYDESKVGSFSLPDLLTLNNGKKVLSPAQWYHKRRPKILKIVEENQFGRHPKGKPALRYDVTEDEGFGGEARRKQVTIYFSKSSDSPRVDVLIYLPKDSEETAVPLLLNLSFSQNNISVDDKGIKEGRKWDSKTLTSSTVETPSGERPYSLNPYIKKFLDAGYGFATLCYTDFEPDFAGAEGVGVRGLFKGKRKDNEWGAISAWSWGVSRVVDYFEKDPDIDATRIALTGCSRLGKTTLWASARDERIAVVIASCSGEGGAALSRRNYGETIAHLTAPTRFPYQFCRNYSLWGDKIGQMPMDSHMLLSLIAPRPLLLSTGSTDKWSDPKGEFCAAVEAGKVYELLGKDDLGTNVMPPAESPILHTLGFVVHEGGHGVLPQDWDYYLTFLEKYL